MLVGRVVVIAMQTRGEVIRGVLQRGLERYGYAREAAEVRRGMLELVERGGFWEHYSPRTGRGHGAEQFAWTAGLTLDILSIEEQRKERAWRAPQSPRPQQTDPHSGHERRE